MMYYYNDYLPFHMFGFGSMFMILFWIFIIYGVISFFKHETRSRKTSSESSSAVSILKERYAKGEINKEEFTSIKKDLE